MAPKKPAPPSRRPARSKPSTALEKADQPIRVPSTRADGGPAKTVALRAGEVFGAGTTHQIQTTFQPWKTITVSETEYQSLLAQGLVYSGSPVAPVADFYDGILADKVTTGAKFPQALATAAADSANPFGSSLRAAYVSPLAKRATTPVVFAGDSITADSATGTTGHLASAGAAAIGLYPVGSVGVATGVSDAGVGGNTSTQLLARFDTDVIAKAPKLVHILIGTNDASADTPVATLAANIKAMVAKCTAIGAQLVLGTVPPNGTGTPADRKALIVAYNQWICRYAISQGFPVADYYRALVDPATGGYLAAYDSGDHTHPSPAGTGAMAAELAAAISRPLSSALLLTKDANDPWNFCRNGLFLSAWGTGWTAPSGTGVTASTTSGDTSIQGNWGKIAAVASSATAAASQNQTTTQGGTGYTAGHRMMFGARVQSSALSSAQTWSARVRTTDGAYDLRPGPGGQRIAYTGAGGLVYLREGAAAPTVSYVQSEVELAAGTGDVSVAQFTAYDLTAMGVTDVNGVLI